jgi:hypothetical protein
MQGGAGEAEGLIPRSVKQILRAMAALTAQGWAFTAEASFLEIYNEALRDLLSKAPPAAASSSSSSSSSAPPPPPPPLTVHQDAEGNVSVPGLTRCSVTAEGDVGELLARAGARRATAATSMNAHSSRSHAVFTLHLRGAHGGGGGRAPTAIMGSLSLVDLAGSERLARSGAEGERKREAAAINKSLSCLADVFTALGKRAPHVPFRNSRLTWLLSPALRGDGKTLMLVGVSPAPGSAGETLCSVRFAAAVSQVELRGGAGAGARARAPLAQQQQLPPPPPTPAQAPPVHAAAAAALDASGVRGLLDVSYMEEGGEDVGGEEEEGGEGGKAEEEEGGGGGLGSALFAVEELAVGGEEAPAPAAAAAVPPPPRAAPPPAPPAGGASAPSRAARAATTVPPPPMAAARMGLSASALAGGGGGASAARAAKRGAEEGAAGGGEGGKRARLAASFAGRA